MIPYPFVKGMDFRELICLDQGFMERLITLVCRSGLDPNKAMKKLNQGAGKEVVKIHGGKLSEYEEIGPERSVIVKDIEHVAAKMTIIRVKFEDGLEGWTYRFEAEVDPATIGKTPTAH